MNDMTPQEAARIVRGEVSYFGYPETYQLAVRILADIADPPKPKAEWRVGEGVALRCALRDGMVVAVCYDNIGGGTAPASAHRATVTMHALRADEEGIDVVALIEEARHGA